MLRLIAFRSFGDGAEGTHVFVPAQGCQALWAYQSFCALEHFDGTKPD